MLALTKVKGALAKHHLRSRQPPSILTDSFMRGNEKNKKQQQRPACAEIVYTLKSTVCKGTRQSTQNASSSLAWGSGAVRPCGNLLF